MSLSMVDGRWQSRRSSGGLVTALSGFDTGQKLWVGWPGAAVPEAEQGEVRRVLAEDRLVPVFFGVEDEEHYYRGYSNAVLWPLFHYFSDRVDLEDESWGHYRRVNELFAETILDAAPENARVWIHDFHLFLVPGILRQQRPDLEIGFFLHIPFPSSEIYRLLPQREELMHGILGADYISFHTHGYANHFRSSCLRVLGVESRHDSLEYRGRRVTLGVDPIGIDVERFEDVLQLPETGRLFGELQRHYGNRKMILGIERLDYTKGVRHKFRAFERFLERDPRRAEEVTMLQVLVPSRLNHPEYQELKSELEENVGRVNGNYGRPGVTPVEYLHRHLTPEQLVALYRYAHVGMVTPVRDGMNLVAQEFVLCQGAEAPELPACRGMLVLSEFAGAANSLSRSILVNPWDIDRTADALEAGLELDSDEKFERMMPMVLRVRELDSRRWAATFTEQLGKAADLRRANEHSTTLRETEIQQIRGAFLEARHRHLFFDYDGTLREITLSPEEARPTAEILLLLSDLAKLPDTDVYLVSGRPREVMQAWFGGLPINMCAEHGYASREPDGDWRDLADLDLSWMSNVRQILVDVSREVPGTMVESKTCAIAWHYRMADLDYGIWRARELLNTLESDLANQPVEVIPGHRVIEVRAAGVNKGRYVAARLTDASEQDLILCIGDDRTDRDMYAVLPEDAISVHVGGAAEEARFTVESPVQVRSFLRSLLEAYRVGPHENPDS